MLHHRRRLGHGASPQELLADEQDAVVDAPEDVVPCGPVPQASDRPHDGDVEHPPGRRHARPAERDVDVIAEERVEADVPPAPELADRLGDVGVVEVAQVLEAQHAPQADGHVGVAAEIEEDLERVGDKPRPGANRADRRAPEPEHLVGEDRADVGEQDLLGESDDEEPQPGMEPLERLHAVEDLVGYGRVADDRPGDKLGEAGDVHAQIQQALLRGDVAPVHVDDVGERLQRVEADADGKGKLEVRDEGEPKQRIHVVGKETLVLEEPYYQDVEDDGEGEQNAPAVDSGVAAMSTPPPRAFRQSRS